MENKDKEIQSLGTNFEVIEDAPAAPAQPAATAASAPPPPGAPPAGAPQPVRKAVINASMGLAIGLAGLLVPYGAPELIAVAAIAGAAAAWGLVRYGVLRAQPTATGVNPMVPGLLLIAGVLGIVGATSGGTVEEPGTFGNTGAGMLGAVITLLGALLALAGPAMARKSDSKLPPAAPEPAVDHQFSVSLLCYLLILAMMPLKWSNGGGTGAGSILGVFTILFCVIGAVGSFSGMFRGWAMRGVTGGLGGMALFLAPLEAALYGILGLVRVAMGDGAVEAIDSLGDAWPGAGDQDFLLYGLPPLVVALAGIYGTFVLFQGAKKGIEANKKRKEEEIASRKAERAARKDSGDDGKAAAPAPPKAPEVPPAPSSDPKKT